MDAAGYQYAESIRIDRPPAEVYDIVTTIDRHGDLSPVCHSGTWDDADHAGREGAWFTGHNAVGDVRWDTRCQVAVARSGREFTFINHGPDGDHELVRWGYTFEATGGGTEVTESWQVLPAYPEFVRNGDDTIDVKARIDGMARMAKDGIHQTLANLKMVAES
jgi:Polyketide cyclase / dehydrase and lipid transport